MTIWISQPSYGFRLYNFNNAAAASSLIKNDSRAQVLAVPNYSDTDSNGRVEIHSNLENTAVTYVLYKMT